jgi:hypothetical protein
VVLSVVLEIADVYKLFGTLFVLRCMQMRDPIINESVNYLQATWKWKNSNVQMCGGPIGTEVGFVWVLWFHQPVLITESVIK